MSVTMLVSQRSSELKTPAPPNVPLIFVTLLVSQSSGLLKAQAP